MKRKNGLIYFVIFTWLVSVLPVLGTTTANDTFKKKVDSIDGQVDAINKKLTDLKKEKKSLLNDIYEIELKYEKEVIGSNKIKLQLTDTRGKIKKKEKEKIGMEQLVDKSKENLRKIIRILYKIGGNTYLKIFIRVDTIDQLFKNYRLFMSLIRYKSEEINRLKENIRRLNEIRSQLQAEHTKLQGFKEQQDQKIRNVRRFKQGKLNLIRRINNDRKEYVQLLDELKYESARLNEVISGKKVKSSLRELDLKKIKGRLRWPVRGRVISSFGKKRSTRFNTYVLNNGIKIRPTGSNRVKAVYSGDVAFAEYYKGYGNLIIIQHSRELYTLYGQCQKFLKKKGDHIMAGQEIAIVGDTGSTTGKSLYFEVRTGLKTQNPLTWLRKR
ncbi:MAG: peptidoglycan DD-metalloendopeptidase family protein [bacterium]|nr:peptidoglycan DD-metalloendopeptidase family protein [bacterium]